MKSDPSSSKQATSSSGGTQAIDESESLRSREKPLAIRGTLDDVLRAAMNVKPKDQQMKTNQP